MAAVHSGLRAVGRILRDTPGAFRNRIRTNGLKTTVLAIPQMVRFALAHYFRDHSPVLCTYDQWLSRRVWNAARRERVLSRLKAAGRNLPKISVVVPVYNTPERWLNRAIESVVEQVYPNWELCLADDASPSPHVRPILEQWAKRDARIRVSYCPANGGISRCTNAAAAMASGDFIAFLDHDDELSPDCLAEVAIKLAGEPEADLLYTDDDKIDETGRRYGPQFKGDFSPALLLCYMYFCHLMVIRRELYEQLGGMREGYEGSQDHDLALRASEVARKVVHVPEVLYHWRAIAGSTALGTEQKRGCFDATSLAVQDALNRRSAGASAYRPNWAVAMNLGDCACEFADDGPSVTIIIPTRNGLKLLKTCIESLAATTYRNYRILVVDNESDDPATLAYLKNIPGQVLRLASPGGKFSFAYLNNRAVEQCETDYVLLLNNDTEVVEPRWLSRMMGYACMPGVGSVGARLLFPDGRVQHCGIAHGGSPLKVPWHLYKFAPDASLGYMRLALSSREVAAVTAACMVTPRKLYLGMGGLDEKRFNVAFNDVDYGYRLVQAGYRNIYCASAVLKHYESVSRGYDDNPEEHIAVKQLYGGWPDPYVSPHFQIVDHDLVLVT